MLIVQLHLESVQVFFSNLNTGLNVDISCENIIFETKPCLGTTCLDICIRLPIYLYKRKIFILVME